MYSLATTNHQDSLAKNLNQSVITTPQQGRSNTKFGIKLDCSRSLKIMALFFKEQKERGIIKM